MAVTLEQINAATDALTLQRLQTQIQFEQAEAYKAELAKIEAYRAGEAAKTAAYRADNLAAMQRNADSAEAMVVFMRQQGTAFDASERGAVLGKVFEALVAKYMTTGTATDPATQATDAQRDANYLKVAVQAVMGTYDALRTPAA